GAGLVGAGRDRGLGARGDPEGASPGVGRQLARRNAGEADGGAGGAVRDRRGVRGAAPGQGGDAVRVVGKSVVRNDALEKVTGRTAYVDDVGLQGMLYACTVRSPRPHIFIKKLETKAAEAVKGFVRLVTAADVPGKNQVPL